jgi:hypothetical protein
MHSIKKKDWQCMYNITLKHVYATIVAIQKLYILHTLVALDIQHAMHMHCSILSSVACPLLKEPATMHIR